MVNLIVTFIGYYPRSIQVTEPWVEIAGALLNA